MRIFILDLGNQPRNNLTRCFHSSMAGGGASAATLQQDPTDKQTSPIKMMKSIYLQHFVMKMQPLWSLRSSASGQRTASPHLLSGPVQSCSSQGELRPEVEISHSRVSSGVPDPNQKQNNKWKSTKHLAFIIKLFCHWFQFELLQKSLTLSWNTLYIWILLF